MLEFDASYFRDEEREGFLVTEEVKRLWAAQLVMLKEIEKICDRNGLTYYAAWGTMLGAARHKGYVPWDDDLDICMKRSDYMKFLQIAERELPERYSLMNLHNDKGFTDLMTRVLNQRMFDLSEEHLAKFYGCPYVIGIDIFPLDYIPRQQGDYFFVRELMNLVYSTGKDWDADNRDKDEQEHLVSQIEELCAVKLDRSGDMQQQLMKLAEQLCMLYGDEDADDLGYMILQITNPFFLYPKHCFERVRDLPFENTTVRMPEGYIIALSQTYPHWRIPNPRWAMHDYPYYNSQKPVLEKYREMLKQ